MKKNRKNREEKIRVRKSKEGLMNSKSHPHKDKSKYQRKNKRGEFFDLEDEADEKDNL